MLPWVNNRLKGIADMTKRTIEIRSGEGGLDAKLFVADLAEAYRKLATRKG